MAVRQFAVALLLLAMLSQCYAPHPHACCEAGSCVCPYVSRLHRPGNHGYGILTTGKRHGPAVTSPQQQQVATPNNAPNIAQEAQPPRTSDIHRENPDAAVRARLYRLAGRLHNIREKTLTKAPRMVPAPDRGPNSENQPLASSQHNVPYSGSRLE